MNDDLVNSLIKTGNLDEAIWICEQMRQQNPQASLTHARWIGKHAVVMAEKQSATLYDGRSADLAGRLQQCLVAATTPIDVYLRSHPDFAATEFLSADKITASFRILRTAMIVASVSNQDETNAGALLRSVSQLQRDCETLEKSVSAKWAIANTGGQNDPGIAADQWERLGRELAVRQVSLAILQTELFTPGTDDYASAAANAVSAATSALAKLPDDAPVKNTARQLLVEALLRSGDLEGARRNLSELTARSGDRSAATLVALDAKIKLAENQISRAKQAVESFDASRTNIGSSEVDFVKLQILLQEDPSGQAAGQWLRQIEKRGGAFARRRGETMIVRYLRRQGATESSTSGRNDQSASVLAAQGEDWLRQGDFDKAAQLLRNAAEVATEADALQLAAKSAAAANKGGNLRHASETLRLIALSNADAEGAFSLAVQAALLLSKAAPGMNDDDRVSELETLLRDISQTWPNTEKTPAIAEWLCRIYAQSARQEDAAEFALEWFVLRKDPVASRLVETVWFDHVRNLPEQETQTELNSLALTTCELARENPNHASAVLPLAALLFDDPKQFDVEFVGGDSPEQAFVETLWKLRTSGQGKFEFDQVSDARLKRARWRLERDLSTDTAFSRPIAQQLRRWPSATPWQRAKVEFWLSEDQASIDAMTQMVTASDADATVVQEAMRLLSHSQTPNAKQAAARIAEQLASSMKLGSEPWYEAKLNAIKWLHAAGDVQEAGKRASYLLLLHPPEDEGVRQELQRYRER